MPSAQLKQEIWVFFEFFGLKSEHNVLGALGAKEGLNEKNEKRNNFLEIDISLPAKKSQIRYIAILILKGDAPISFKFTFTGNYWGAQSL